MCDYVTQAQKLFHPSILILTELMTVWEISVLHNRSSLNYSSESNTFVLLNVLNYDITVLLGILIIYLKVMVSFFLGHPVLHNTKYK